MTDTAQPASVYDLARTEEAENLATFAVLVDNEPGVLHRLVGLFAARGYNIESLTVAETGPQAAPKPRDHRPPRHPARAGPDRGAADQDGLHPPCAGRDPRSQ